MIAAGDFRKGSKFVYKDAPHVVVDFQHVKPGKGGAFMRTKMKNMITGSTYEETFRSEEKFPTPNLEHRQMQYLYSDGTEYHFMDQESYEQLALSLEQIEEVRDYLKEQTVYDVLYFEGSPIAVTAPITLELLVTEAPPGVRGNTAQGGATKPVTLESGLVVQAPLFVNTGDLIKIDTRTGVYVERITKK